MPYIPPLRFTWLTRWYDFLIRWTIRESTFKRRLLAQAGLRNGDRVLDLGCGTATLTLMVARAYPGALVAGVDADPAALALARSKAAQAGLGLQLTQAFASSLPYPDGSFDRVLSSLLFHHLTAEEKRRSLEEVWRVLKPGGEIHIADWGQARSRIMRAAFLLVQLIDGFETTGENVKGRLAGYLEGAGFAGVEEAARYDTAFGTISLYRGARPLVTRGSIRRPRTAPPEAPPPPPAR
ncbi:MAG: class I SAM-dependent methyltransferase [Gemmatimonadetes bacterium]|nr:class I SAM-dependent methyltransferase [Gemmatimonadota bacterium]